MKTFDELMVDLTERKAVNLSQRRKMARRMAKMAKSSAFRAKVARKKMKIADTATLHKRALKKAKNIVIQKYAGIDKSQWDEMSPMQKIEIDNRITSKKGAAIQKIAKKMMVKLKKAEVERLKKVKSGDNE